MPKSKGQKGDILAKIKDKIGRSKSMFFVKFNKLTVVESEALRNKIKSEGGDALVAKKTLAGIALKESNMEGADTRAMDGQVLMAFGYEDEVAPAKIIDEFRKGKEDKLEFVGGFLEGKFIDKNSASALAKLPSKLELYAQMVGSLAAPMSGFANVLAGNLRKLVYVVKAIEEKKSN